MSNPATPRAIDLPIVDKSDDPFPPSLQFQIAEFWYGGATTSASPPTLPLGDHLQLVRYNARPLESDPTSDWQLRTGYSVWIRIRYRDDAGQQQEETWKLTAPRGLYTDLSSIPAFGRWIVSKTGPHLEASIIHDWLYLKWTDHRFDDKRISDWVFADAVLAAGLKALPDMHWFKKMIINFAVQTAGWLFFFRKKVPLNILLPRWKQHLNTYPDDHPVPPSEQAEPRPKSMGSRLYAWVILLFSLAIALLGLARIWTALTAWFSGTVPFGDSLIAWHTIGPGAETAAWIGQAAGFVILLFMGTLGVLLALAVLAWGGGRIAIAALRLLGR